MVSVNRHKFNTFTSLIYARGEQYTFELVSKLISEYLTAVWDDPVDPFVYTAHSLISCGEKEVSPILYANQVKNQFKSDFPAMLNLWEYIRFSQN